MFKRLFRSCGREASSVLANVFICRKNSARQAQSNLFEITGPQPIIASAAKIAIIF